MTKSKRPWKRFARIERVELNSGDVKFEAVRTFKNWPIKDALKHFKHDVVRIQHESLDAAEADLGQWWAEWWRTQEKSRRRA